MTTNNRDDCIAFAYSLPNLLGQIVTRTQFALVEPHFKAASLELFHQTLGPCAVSVSMGYEDLHSVTHSIGRRFFSYPCILAAMADKYQVFHTAQYISVRGLERVMYSGV